MAGSLATCLHSVGFEMPHVSDVVPLLDVDGVVEAVTARLQCPGPGGMYNNCPRASPTQGVVSCTYDSVNSGLSLIACAGGIASSVELLHVCAACGAHERLTQCPQLQPS